jgi:hypothetical protein
MMVLFFPCRTSKTEFRAANHVLSYVASWGSKYNATD